MSPTWQTFVSADSRSSTAFVCKRNGKQVIGTTQHRHRSSKKPDRCRAVGSHTRLEARAAASLAQPDRDAAAHKVIPARDRIPDGHNGHIVTVIPPENRTAAVPEPRAVVVVAIPAATPAMLRSVPVVGKQLIGVARFRLAFKQRVAERRRQARFLRRFARLSQSPVHAQTDRVVANATGPVSPIAERTAAQGSMHIDAYQVGTRGSNRRLDCRFESRGRFFQIFTTRSVKASLDWPNSHEANRNQASTNWWQPKPLTTCRDKCKGTSEAIPILRTLFSNQAAC